MDPPGSHTHGFMRFPVGEHKQVRTREAEEGLQNELPLQLWERRPTPIHMEQMILRHRLPPVGLGLQNLGWNILPCHCKKKEMEEAITGKTNEFVAGENRRVRECGVP